MQIDAPRISDTPRYLEIVHQIRGDILSGKLLPGDRLPTTTELRKQFSVTIDTLQKSLTLLAQDGYVSRVPRRGTFVCDRRGLKTILVVLGQNIYTHENSAFYISLLESFRTVAMAGGYEVELRLLLEGSGFQAALDRLKTDIETGHFGLVKVIYGNGPLMQWIDNECPLPVVPQHSQIDIYNFGYRGINYLVERGYQHIHVVIPNQRVREGNPAFEGIWAGLSDRGLSREQVSFHEDSATEEGGYRLIKDVIRTEGIMGDCLFSLNDNMTRGVMFGLVEAGVKIPDSVGVLTHANRGSHILSPVPLTRLEFDPDKMAKQVFNACLSHMRAETLSDRSLTPDLVTGESCGEKRKHD